MKTLSDRQKSLISVAERRTVRMGLVGLGGYARGLTEVIESATPQTELVACCDLDLRRHAKEAQRFREAGGTVYPSFDAMIEGHRSGQTPLDAIWLPVPIHLHRPFVERCLDAGIAVMVEKPAAGSLEDVDAMITARDRAGLPVLVGFQDLYFTENHEAKKRLLAQEIGPIRRVSILACWPRSEVYYARNNWAGALQREGTWVRDSPLNNALAHPVHLAMFMLGPTPQTCARAVRLQADLYRANVIESFDTCSIRLHTGTGVEVSICFTHACVEEFGPITTYHGEAGTLEASHHDLTFIPNEGPRSQVQIVREMSNLPRRLAAAILNHDTGAQPAATLETARVHTAVVEALHQHTPIIDIPRTFVRQVADGTGQLNAVPGIEAALAQCAREGCLLSELPPSDGATPWPGNATGVVELHS